MQTLRECIVQAEQNKVAIGHFNISNIETLWGIFNAARKLNVPVIIGVSEGERDFIGVKQAAALVRSIRDEYEYEGEPYPIFLNADHTYSFERVKEAIDAGYDAVIFDGAKLTLEENIKITKQCVEYARSVSTSRRIDILVEGELGYIGTSSKLLDSIPEGAAVSEEMLTKSDELFQFVKATGVDLAAPAVGNLHGILKTGRNPELNIARIKELRNGGGVPLVLHGGSGISEDDFRNAIATGISIVHINTEIRVAYKKGVQMGIQENPDEIAPYKFMKEAVRAVEEVVERRLRLFNS